MAATISNQDAVNIASRAPFGGMGILTALHNAGALDVADHPSSNVGQLPMDSPPDGSLNTGMNIGGSTGLSSVLSKVTPKAGYA